VLFNRTQVAPNCLRDSRQPSAIEGRYVDAFPLARERRSPAGFIRPAQPVLADRPPTGPGWSFEIKHDGFRMVPRKDGERVRLWSRNARDWSVEFRAIAEAVRALPFSGVVLDGEAVAHCPEGLPDFHGLLGDGAASACLYAFDLLAVEGEDLRRLPLEALRERLADLLADTGPALRLSEHLDGDGAVIFEHACRLGLEGVIAKAQGLGLSLGAVRLVGEGEKSGLREAVILCRRECVRAAHTLRCRTASTL
jgi:bifunctional non-homologous end joining protein LigD